MTDCTNQWEKYEALSVPKPSQDQRPAASSANPVVLHDEQKQNQKDSPLSLPRPWVQYLVGELRHCKPSSMAKNNQPSKQTKKQKKSLNQLFPGYLLFPTLCWMPQEKKLVKKTDALVFLWILHLEESQWANNHSSCVKYQYYRRKVLDTPRCRLGALIYIRPEGESFGEGLKLMVQWLRVGLATQGTRVWSLVQEDPESLGTARPVYHSNCACTAEPGSCNNWVPGPAPTEAQCPRVHVLQQKTATRRILSTATREEVCAQQRRPSMANNEYS